MIENSRFKNRFSEAENLSNRLHERVFLKTELDFVYTNITNWERYGLFEIGGENGKGDWKKINYMEYIWLNIISDLRSYGYTYNEILDVKEFLFKKITFGDVLSAAEKDEENKELIQSIDTNKQLENIDITNQKEIEVGYILEALVSNIIIRNEQLSLFISKENPSVVIPMSKEIIKGFDKIGELTIIDSIFDRNFCAISLGRIVSKFLVDNDKTIENRFTSILTNNEQKLLKMVRKNLKSIKNISIRFLNGEMNIIEITTIKKVLLESRLLEHIRKGDYQKITIDSVDGSIVNFENTQKIKL